MALTQNDHNTSTDSAVVKLMAATLVYCAEENNLAALADSYENMVGKSPLMAAKAMRLAIMEKR